MSKTIKCLLRSFLTEEGKALLLPRIAEAVPIVDRLVTETYHLMGLHFRRLLEEDPNWIPSSLDDKYILRFMRILHDASNYTPEVDIFETKTKFYDPLRRLAELDPFVSPWPAGLNQIKQYAAIEMATCIQNNVKLHFGSRVRKFVALARPDLTKKERSQLVDGWWKASHAPEYPFLFPRPNILQGPLGKPATVEYSLAACPEVFIPSMWFMLRAFDSHNVAASDPIKLFSLLPLRKGFGAHHVRIDTATVESWTAGTDSFRTYVNIKNASLLQTKEAIAQSQNIHKRVHRDKSVTAAERDVLWEPLLRKRSLRGLGKFVFGYSFATDGVSVSILCQRSLRKQPKRAKTSPQEEPVSIPQDGRKLVGVDPGKHSILYMASDSAAPGDAPEAFERLEYSSRRRRREMKVPQFRKWSQDRKLTFVQTMETELSRTDSKSPRTQPFSSYLLARFSRQDALYDYYDDRIFAKMRFRTFQGRQQSEAQLLKDIERTFGHRDTIALALGNWSRRSQMKRCAPSPVVGMKKLLQKHFRVYVVDEFRTTKTCGKCGGEMKADPTRACARLNRRTGRMQNYENRSLRRCQNEECGALFSRDYNAAINIRKQALHLRNHGQPHPWFARPPREDNQDRILVSPN